MLRNLVVACVGLVLLVSSCSAQAESRGYRNNNPGNLIKTSIPWKGKVKCADRTFECFSSPYYGIRAMTKTLVAYRERHNLYSLAGIIHRWSPPHENSTDSFITYLQHRVGTLGGRFYEKLPILIQHMLKFENGYEKYSYDFIEGVIRDTIRNYDTLRLYPSRRPHENVEHEAKDGGPTPSADHAGSHKTAGREDRDTGNERGEVYMDSSIYRYHCSANGVCTPKGRSADMARKRSSGVRLDGSRSGLPILYQRF